MMNEYERIKHIIFNRKHKTNCFIFPTEILKLKEKNILTIYLIKNNVFIFYKANGFYKFYYFVEEYRDIQLAKELLDTYSISNIISLEFTTKHNKNIDKISQAITLLDFNFYRKFVRLLSGTNNLKINTSVENEVQYELANLSDICNLVKIMHQEFDPIIDDIPTEKELEILINNKSVMIKRYENKIIMIQIFEYKTGYLYSRMTWIEKKFRKPRYTVEIYNGIDTYIKELNITSPEKIRAYYWLDEKSKNFLIGKKLGSIEDGLSCTSFIYKNREKIKS